MKEVITKKANTNYKAINRTAAQDTSLSLKAKGLMFYLLSKPDTWTIRKRNLVSSCSNGREAVEGAIAELREKGYLTLVKVITNGKLNGSYYILNDEVSS